MKCVVEFDPNCFEDLEKLRILAGALVLQAKTVLEETGAPQEAEPAPKPEPSITPEPKPIFKPEPTVPEPLFTPEPETVSKTWTPELINEEILIPLMKRVGQQAFEKEAISKRFQPILQVEFQASGLTNVAPEKLGDVARRLTEIITRDFPEGYKYEA